MMKKNGKGKDYYFCEIIYDGEYLNGKKINPQNNYYIGQRKRNYNYNYYNNRGRGKNYYGRYRYERGNFRRKRK